MAKYIIDVKDGETLYKAVITPDGEPYITPAMGNVYTEPDLEQVKRDYDAWYEKGLVDAWEAARKVVALSTVDRRKVFGSEYMYSILEKHTASEAIEKIRQYEQKKDGLRQNIQTIVDQCGYTLDEIAEVLQKMREDAPT